MKTQQHFENKPIITEKTLGELFREEREALSLTVEQAAKKCRLDPKYIMFLENGSYERLPGGLYTKQFVRRYAEVLGFDSVLAVDRFSQETRNFRHVRRPDALPRPIDKELRSGRIMITPVLIRNLIIVFFVLIGLLYIGWEIYDTVTPPQLTITSPGHEIVTKDRQIEITGSTEPESMVFINDEEIFVHPDGSFRENISLQPGVNLIEVTSVKKHSRARLEQLEILVEESGEQNL